MKNFAVLVLLSLTFSLPAGAQDRASMTAPVIKTTAEEVTFTVRFEDFVSGSEYRLGVGTAAGNKLTNVKMELSRNDQALKKNLVNFDQGYTASWWNVDKVSVQGFVMTPAELPGKDQKLVLKVTVLRAEADKVKKIFVLVARKYGEDRWYVEDGVELNDSHW